MIQLEVTGMTCGHCEASVKRALEGVDGVEEVVSVARDPGAAEVEGDVDPAVLVKAIEEAGYQAKVAG